VLFSDSLNFSSTLKFTGTFHTPYDRSNCTSAYCNLRFLFGKLEDGISWMLLPRELQNMFRLRTLVFGVNTPEVKCRSHYFASHMFCYADICISTQQIPWWQTITSNISDLEIQVHSTRGIILFYIRQLIGIRNNISWICCRCETWIPEEVNMSALLHSCVIVLIPN
jgi:hypothetical protein